MSTLPHPTDTPTGAPAAVTGDAATTVVTVLPHAELCPDGLRFAAPRGRLLVDELLAHGVAIEHACDKVCACATCHVYLRDGAQGVAPADDDEEDQLGDAWGLTAASRLSCCVRLDGPALTVELPRY
jgi:2Fe-2S ferredoxin